MTVKSASAAVLLNVDDNEPARYARHRVLEKAGFVVHDAENGREALQLLSEVQPNVVLLDVHLPDIDGIEVCRQIRQQTIGRSIIVLQISASAGATPNAIAALNMGADCYLAEPVDPDVLVATVRSFMRLQSAERAIEERNAELKRANDALKRSNEDLEHFAYIASHDLQEPLRTITTHLQLLERNADGNLDDSLRQSFHFVIDAALRMSTLIQDLLAYSRIGMQPARNEVVSLNESLTWALENLALGIAGSKAEITCDELPMVRGDALQLSQVFQNLVGNSIKYRSDAHPLRVHISSSRGASGDWLIQVQDNGIGIGAEYAEQIFRPFKRLHGQEIPGNGIGLALTRRIIESHGGTIWVESSPGCGATFLFTLKPSASGAKFA